VLEMPKKVKKTSKFSWLQFFKNNKKNVRISALASKMFQIKEIKSHLFTNKGLFGIIKVPLFCSILEAMPDILTIFLLLFLY
jgi:hypothetical protein